MKKALVLYSGGLDSRLVVKLLQEKGFDVVALHFKLPFGCGCFGFKFIEENEIKLKILDCTKGSLFKEYLEILKSPKFGVGTGINPCKDCKIFMFKKAKEYADSQGIEIIATGEVIGQRPMSQTAGAMKKIDEVLGFEIQRPLIELGISGRQRVKQMELAEKFGIKYPNPGGGCLLCEKALAKRFKVLFDNDLIDDHTLPLSFVGRHFWKDGCWFVVARNEGECSILEKFDSVVAGEKGKPAVYYNENSEKDFALKIQKAYEDRKPEDFLEWKI